HRFTGFKWDGFGQGTLQLPNGKPPAIETWTPAIGDKTAFGSSKITFAVPIIRHGFYRTGYEYEPCVFDDQAAQWDCPEPAAPDPPPLDQDVPMEPLVLGGAGSFNSQQPLIVYNDFVETTGGQDNQMRYLDNVRIVEKSSE